MPETAFRDVYQASHLKANRAFFILQFGKTGREPNMGKTGYNQSMAGMQDLLYQAEKK